MGSIFETMCRYYLLLNSFSDLSPCMITEVGKWFGTDPQKREQTDIDVVGLDKEEGKAVIGECKFKNETMDKSVLDVLISRDGLLDKKYSVVSYYLFSLSGFSDWLVKNAEEMNTKLISLNEMY